MPTVSKDPADIHPILANHAAQMTLDGDTIDTSDWRIEGALDEDDQPVDGWLEIDDGHAASHTDTTATVWITGGTAGGKYEVVNTITTAAGRTWERTIDVTVYDK